MSPQLRHLISNKLKLIEESFQQLEDTAKTSWLRSPCAICRTKDRAIIITHSGGRVCTDCAWDLPLQELHHIIYLTTGI